MEFECGGRFYLFFIFHVFACLAGLKVTINKLFRYIGSVLFFGSGLGNV